MSTVTPFEAMRLFAAALIDELEDEHSCTEVSVYRATLADIEEEAAAAAPATAEVVTILREDAVIGRGLRMMATGLGDQWRLGLIRTETGWRLVLLNPTDGDPVSFVDGATLADLFGLIDTAVAR